MTQITSIPTTLRAIRSSLNLTQEQLASRLGVSFATVNRWEGGDTKPQRAAVEVIQALAREAHLDGLEEPAQAAAEVTGRRVRRSDAREPTTKPMEQMLWDAACSIRGEKDAPKFKDYLLPLLFLKRLSDVFDDEIARLAEDYGDRDTALEIAEGDHSLLRFYLPPEARWGAINGREHIEWPVDDNGQSTKPKDIGEHLTKAVRAVVKQNPRLSGVIDVVDFAAERNGERDINPAKLRLVVETFSDPRYRLGLADVQPDFLGRAYEYLLRKFAEGSGQSAGEFFTPTEVGFLMANIMRPRPGEDCHDYACGSAGLLVKLQIVARELDPTAKVPLKLTGQELQAESYAVAQMNGIIHDMEIEIARGDTMINPKFRTNEGKVRGHDIVVANPMWNQPFAPDVFANDPFDRFRTTGGVTGGKGDWAWLQHTLACLNANGRAAVVLDTGAVTRGSGSKNEDKERNIRKWFVDQDLIDGVILLPDNLFYNTTAAGVILVLSRRKSPSRKGKIVLLNATNRVKKGKPKNYIPEELLRPLAASYLRGEPVDGEIAVITQEEAAASDYNLNPGRWITTPNAENLDDLGVLLAQLSDINKRQVQSTDTLVELLDPLLPGNAAAAKGAPLEAGKGSIPVGWKTVPFANVVKLQRGFDLPVANRQEGKVPVFGSNGIVGHHAHVPENIPVPGVIVGRSGSVGQVRFVDEPYWPLNTTLFAGEFFDNNEQYVAYFLGYFDLSSFAQGVSVPTLNRNSFSDVPIAVPPPQEQRSIAAVLQIVEHAINLQDQRTDLLRRLFKVMRERLMKGDVRVSDLDLAALTKSSSVAPFDAQHGAEELA